MQSSHLFGMNAAGDTNAFARSRSRAATPSPTPPETDRFLWAPQNPHYLPETISRGDSVRTATVSNHSADEECKTDKEGATSYAYSDIALGSTATIDYYHNNREQPTGRRDYDKPLNYEQRPPPTPTPPRPNSDKHQAQTSFLQRKTTRFAPTWIVALLALGTTAVTVWYSSRVMVNTTELPKVLQRSPGSTVLVVNVLSHIVAFLCLSLFSDVLESLRWALACRPKGILLTSFLAMSRATPVTGVLYLCKVRGSHQIWAIQRILSYVITIVLSLILIANVTFKVVYTPFDDESVATQTVVGGLAPLGTSGIGDLDIALIPLLAATYSIAFITDPRFVTKVSPIGCSASDPNCLSLLMPGGMEVVRAYEKPSGESNSQTLFSGNFSGDYDSVVVNNAPGYQIEYDSIPAVDPNFRWNRTLIGGDCTMFGGDIGEGMYLCQHEVGNSLYLGWTICPDAGVATKTCQTDLSWTDDVKWNTTVSLYQRRSTVAYDSTNISILSVESMSDPTPVKVNGSDLSLYASIVMGPIDPVINWTADNATYAYSSARFDFAYGVAFLLRLYTSDYSTYQDGGVYLLRSFIAVPFQFATAMRQYGHLNLMPPENTVSATLSKSSYRAIIDEWTVWAFGWLALPLIFYCTLFLVWMGVWGPYSPNISMFPEIDITSKSSVHMLQDKGSGERFGSDMDPHLEMADQTLEDLGRLTRSHGMGDGASLRIVENIRGRRVFCGSLLGLGGKEMGGSRDGQEELIVLLTEEAGRLKCLNRYAKYA
ncbi:hypothetical protein QBC46DRAFT_388109 [Diplogelasinospora grovesii]|uniref:Uncharacterized protein n=1 Tax=Diplogelasinospora grovesii TaxID=303347 RepID=A0AAN6N718_9PEZI|nr:hypothetical protein QBC46DRAFT_388109 [Diplogelasinospora grovesii]